MINERLLTYARELFATEDAALQAIRARQLAAGLPDINISADEGKILRVLLTAIGAKRVLEVGTLGGYSGVWLARALPADGELVTIERDPHHAAVARKAFEEAGLVDRVKVIEGAGTRVLPTLEPPFDAVFLDADKAPLPDYYAHAMRLLRIGGLVLIDNAFYNGKVLDTSDETKDTIGVRQVNRLTSSDPRLMAAVIPVRDGLIVGVKVGR